MARARSTVAPAAPGGLGLDMELVGFDELTSRLAALPGKIQRGVVRKTLRSQATKLARRIKAGTPRVSGAGQASVKIKVRVSDRGGYARVKYSGRPAMYLRIRERGSRANPGRFGRRHRNQPARPFFAAAVAGWDAEARQEFEKALERALSKAEEAA